MSDLTALVPLAPLHQPHNLAAIVAVRATAPNLPQVACFDTAFHRNQPLVAQEFALPRDYTAKGLLRYGFHGLSYEYIVSVLPDVAAASLLASGRIGCVVVGADRIARNGDTANKVGTYPLALAAHAAGVPFFVAAPLSTLDLRIPTGAGIPIEERAAAEVTHLGGQRVAAEGVQVFNPAFDVTPSRYVAAIVTERGVARAPYELSLPALADRSP